MNDQATPQGMDPAKVLLQHPGPWNQVTYVDGSIRVWDRHNVEVDLFSLLAFAIGLVNQTPSAKMAAAEAAARAN